MNCQPHNSRKLQPARGQVAVSKCAQRGHTLMEMLVTLTVGGIILTAAMALYFYSARSFAALGNYGDLDAASRNALDTMSRDIRQARGLTNFASTKLLFTDPDNNSLVYVYDSGA